MNSPPLRMRNVTLVFNKEKLEEHETEFYPKIMFSLKMAANVTMKPQWNIILNSIYWLVVVIFLEMFFC